MKNMILLASLLCTAAMAMGADAPAWQKLEHGQLIVRDFKNAPYPHPSRENGYKTFTRQGHYDDSSVAVFIPAGFVPKDAVNYVVHFHGHKNTVAGVLKTYRLTEQLAASKVNAILIIPQGPKDASDDGFGKLELDPDGLKNLLEEVAGYLKSEGKIATDKIGKVAISAHSGGYNGAGAVLDHGGVSQITDVLLLDASYGSLPWFVAWCAAGDNHRLVSIFSDHLQAKNQKLMGMLEQAKVPCQQLEEKSLTESQLKLRMPTFIHTSLAHNDVPMKSEYFQRLLETSSLDRN